ncbi:MAG: hypothetical protein WBA63_12775 [Thermomicrobiales bacterium]
MSWLQFWKNDKERDQEADAKAKKEDAELAAPPGARLPGVMPPHMQRIMIERRRPDDREIDPAQQLARLRQRRLAFLFDVEQGELAAEDDNPWTNRIALLTEAMETVKTDQQRLRTAEPAPYAPVPPTPIENVAVSEGQPFHVSFTIGPESFDYTEELDWAERGHQLALPELRRQQGNAATLVPPETPADLREALAAHLAHSVDVFAFDMRDRRVDLENLPSHPTLADLASPCPTCGGWADWKGRCAACAARAGEELRLRREEQRLLDERAREAEERHRLTERLPIARRRLADLDADIAKAEQQLSTSR